MSEGDLELIAAFTKLANTVAENASKLCCDVCSTEAKRWH